MDNFIVLDGKKYKLVPEEEQPEKKTGYERVPEGGKYYYQRTTGDTVSDVEKSDGFDNGRYNAGNYYSDEQLAIDNARADTLLRNLRRFAVEHGDISARGALGKYHILKSGTEIYVPMSIVNSRAFGEVWFSSKEAAELAIQTFSDELKWYFFDYDPQLR